MTLWQALALGMVQGLTEFLPISSTAHLILVPWLFGWRVPPETAFPFSVLIQDGTLLAVVVYFRRDLLSIGKAVVSGIASRAPLGTPEARLGWWILLGTIPGVAAGLLLHSHVKAIHREIDLVLLVLIFATGLLYLGEWLGKQKRGIETLGAVDGVAVGLMQTLALVPGVSRSAATMTGGLLRGLDRPAAARFSFLLSIPVLLGAGARETVELLQSTDPIAQLPALAVGFAAAAITGYASIHWLLGFLARRPLTAFGPYRLIAGAGLLLVFWSRR